MSSGLHRCKGKGCRVEISKRKRFCKSCKRDNQMPQERMNSHAHIDERWRTTSQNRSQNTKSKPKIKCRICKKTLQPRSVGERAARGTAGAGMGTVIGGLIGSLAGPLGTLIGAGLGGLAGAGDGSQIENLCENCCRFCENKKSQCICNKIIGLCRSCGCNVTRSNSNNGFCFTCSNSWFGDDL